MRRLANIIILLGLLYSAQIRADDDDDDDYIRYSGYPYREEIIYTPPVAPYIAPPVVEYAVPPAVGYLPVQPVFYPPPPAVGYYYDDD